MQLAHPPYVRICTGTPLCSHPASTLVTTMTITTTPGAAAGPRLPGLPTAWPGLALDSCQVVVSSLHTTSSSCSRCPCMTGDSCSNRSCQLSQHGPNAGGHRSAGVGWTGWHPGPAGTAAAAAVRSITCQLRTTCGARAMRVVVGMPQEGMLQGCYPQHSRVCRAVWRPCKPLGMRLLVVSST